MLPKVISPQDRDRQSGDDPWIFIGGFGGKTNISESTWHLVNSTSFLPFYLWGQAGNIWNVSTYIYMQEKNEHPQSPHQTRLHPQGCRRACLFHSNCGAVTWPVFYPQPRSELVVQPGVPSHRSQDHAACVLPGVSRASSCLGCWGHTVNCMPEGSGPSQGVAYQMNYAHAPTHRENQKWTTEGSESGEKGVQLRADNKGVKLKVDPASSLVSPRSLHC